MSMENREGEGDQGTVDRRIVSGYDNEELFEYCFDQLMNGTRDDRREVVDYLVDEFDEMSLWMVEGFKEFANRDAPQDHQQVDRDSPDSDELEASTSNPTRKSFRLTKKRSSNVTNQQDQATDDTERKDNKTKREYCRKRYQQLKKNPVEYAKGLKQVRDYRARRLERMTDEEKEAHLERERAYYRNYYHNLSAQEKTRRFQREYELKKQKRLESAEYREKQYEYCRKYRAKLTEEQKAKIRAQNREGRQRKWKNMTEAERKVAKQKKAEANKRRFNKKKNKKD